jgi:hypothetical protein
LYKKFEKILERDSLKKDLMEKYSAIFQAYHHELNNIEDKFGKSPPNPPQTQSPVGCRNIQDETEKSWKLVVSMILVVFPPIRFMMSFGFEFKIYSKAHQN